MMPDAAGQPYNGIYAEMFEQEYEDIVGQMQLSLGEDDYIRYLKAISAHDTHAGYFSVDKKGHFVNQVAGDDKREKTSNDISAYDLIMKNKELLLDRDPKRSPVRFIFSHSALREGWDNPNVFQICTLKQSSSEVRKRQEVGRGLRLCVNQNGERMDANVLGNDVHKLSLPAKVMTASPKACKANWPKQLRTVPERWMLPCLLAKFLRTQTATSRLWMQIPPLPSILIWCRMAMWTATVR